MRSSRTPKPGKELVNDPEDLLFGLNNLMAALKTMNGQSMLDKQSELRTQFLCTSVADYASRFRTAVADLKAEGVVLPDGEVGWWFKEKLGLDSLRKQLLDTALQGSENYGTIESESLRLFRDLHVQDPLFRKFDRGGASNKLTMRLLFCGAASSSSVM